MWKQVSIISRHFVKFKVLGSDIDQLILFFSRDIIFLFYKSTFQSYIVYIFPFMCAYVHM